MTTADTPSQAEIAEADTFPAGVVRVFRHTVFMNRIDGVLLQGREEPAWFEPVVKSLARLPWDDDNWNDDAKPTQPQAAARLLALLARILDDGTPPPTLVPTWRGGVQAEWHEKGVYLEIESDPDGALEYYFESDAEEYEGPLTVENLPELVRRAHTLLAGTG